MPMLDGVREKVRTGHANFSFFCAQVGGLLASVSVEGSPIKFLSRLGPWWAPLAWATALLILCVGDWARDSIPNRMAVYTAMLWPSCVVAALTGAQGDKVFSGVKALSATTGAKWEQAVKSFLTPSGGLVAAFTTFSVILLSAAIVYAHRYAKESKAAKSGGGTSGPVGMSTTTRKPVFGK